MPKEHLTNALSLHNVMHQAASIVGPAIAGFVIASQGIAAVYWINAISFLAVLCALNIVFWGCYEQQGNTMQLWADRNTNWNILGFTVPSTWFQAFIWKTR